MSKNRFLGGVWPVVQRELREGARRPVNHRVRLLSAGAGTLVLWAIVANSNRPPAQMGGWLFAGLHTLLLGLILLVVPALTADCIFREKREGTLGLLFLTPLSAGGIVAGKALAQALRAVTLWLAVLPILTIPFIEGGITWFDIFSALSLEFCAAVLCLAAGLLASSLVRERNVAFFLAFALGAIFLFLFSLLFVFLLLGGWMGLGRMGEIGWLRVCLEGGAIFAGLMDVRGFAGWDSLTGFSTMFRKLWVSLCWAGPPIVALIFCLVARFTARRVERSWQDKGPSARREGLVRRYCTPVFRRRFRRKMQRTLDWNPIAWLQQYSWKARLGKWGLCLVLLLGEFIAGKSRSPGQEPTEVALFLILCGICTFVGVSGFLEEKRSGALELLLVTPLSVNKLIFGRVWGLWKQFVPAGLIWASFVVGYEPAVYLGLGRLLEILGFVFMPACAFLALPVFATYFALRVKNLIVAGVLTWIAVCIPYAFAGVASDLFASPDKVGLLMIPLVFIFYLAFALLACFLLRHSLSRRIYAF